MPKETKSVKEIYDELSSVNQTRLRNYVCEQIGMTPFTFRRHLRDGFDFVEEKYFFSWFTDQGISIENIKESLQHLD